MYVEKAAETTFVQKTRAYNVDEIDTCIYNKFHNYILMNWLWSQVEQIEVDN
jgi:hypothetical protein